MKLKQRVLCAVLALMCAGALNSVVFDGCPYALAQLPEGQLKKPTRWQRFRNLWRAKDAQRPDDPSDREPVQAEDYDAFFDGLKARTKDRIVGQDDIIDELADLWAGAVQNPKRKHGVALLLGTTGVGKSYIATVMGEEAFKDVTEKDLKKYGEPWLEIDMTQYKEKHELGKLLGAPPAYIGYKSPGGLLCTWLEKRAGKGGVIVFNELDKVDGEVLDVFMEAFDTGKITCGDEKMREFGPSLIILTSNKNVQNILPDAFVRTASCDGIKQRVSGITPAQIKEAFTQGALVTQTGKNVKREVLERVDTLLFAGPLCRELATQALSLALNHYAKNVHTRLSSSILIMEPGLVENWIDLQYDPVLGVRGIIRDVQNDVAKLVRAHRKAYGHSLELRVALSRNPNMPHLSQLSITNEAGKSYVMKGPRSSATSPLLDPDERVKLDGVEEKLGQIILGQPELVKIGANIIRAQATNPNSKTPISVYVIGTAGSGKTELANAIAEVKWGSRDYVLPINMGDFTAAYDFEHWLNPKGSTGAFEKFLMKYRDGGVLLFDEMSNAGGAYIEQRRDMGLKLYQMLEKGIFVSHATGVSYDLRAYIPYFTGNTGQEFFYGLNSDDELLSTWQMVGNHPDKVSELLLQDGFTPAYLRRITYKAMARPLLHSVKVSLAKKQMRLWLAQMKKSLPMLKIAVSDDFIDSIAHRVYNPKEGGGSIINFISGFIQPAVNHAVLKFNFEHIAEAGHEPWIELSMESIAPIRPFFEKTPDPKLARLTVRATQGGREIYKESSDFTSTARFMKQILQADAWATAYHEAGHAVVNDPFVTGQKLSFLTIIPGEGHLGYARYAQLEEGLKTNFTEADLVMYAARLMAGQAAERLIGRSGGEPNTGRSGDIDQLRKLVFNVGVKHGMIPELIGVRLDKEGNPLLNAQQELAYDNYFQSILKAGDQKAEEMLRERWVLVSRTARALMKKGFIYGNEFDALVKKTRALRPEQLRAFEEQYAIERIRDRYQNYHRTCESALRAYYDL